MIARGVSSGTGSLEPRAEPVAVSVAALIASSSFAPPCASATDGSRTPLRGHPPFVVSGPGAQFQGKCPGSGQAGPSPGGVDQGSAPGGGTRYGSARMAVLSDESRAYAVGVELMSPSDASVQVASSSAASVHEASAQVASAQVASAQVASAHVASAQVAASQTVLFFTASSHVAQPKTGVEPPFGSGTRNLSSARFGFGGDVTD